MIACVDVAYSDDVAFAGCVAFRSWTDAQASEQIVQECGAASAYVPGQFYLRELPPILTILSALAAPPELVVIDGYVWLGADQQGLGARLHGALGERIVVVGVAKTEWRASLRSGEPASRRAVSVRRGGSAKPLYVTAAGITAEEAAAYVATMHGAHRIPTLLKLVDRLVREAAKKPRAVTSSGA